MGKIADWFDSILGKKDKKQPTVNTAENKTWIEKITEEVKGAYENFVNSFMNLGNNSSGTSVPPATSPGTSVPPSTSPGTLVPPSTAPGTLVPPSTAPGTSVPPSTAPGTSVPPSTAPGTSVPPSTAPGTLVPPSTSPGTSEQGTDSSTVGKYDIPKTYDEYAKSSEYLKYVKELADKEKKQNIVDADTAYQQALSGYGKNAELLAKMGLSGSGYSDYLNSQAFAQKMNGIAEANAKHLQTLKDASYQDYVNYESKRNEYRNLYDAYATKLSSGEFSESEVRAMLKNSGLSSEDIESLVKLSNDRNTSVDDSKMTALYDDILSKIYTNNLTTSDLEKLFTLNTYAPLVGTKYETMLRDTVDKTRTEYQEKYNTVNGPALKSQIKSGAFSYDASGAESFEAILAQSDFDETTKENMREEYVNNAVERLREEINSGLYIINEESLETLESTLNDNSLMTKSAKEKVMSAYLCQMILAEANSTAASKDSYSAYLNIRGDLIPEDRKKLDEVFSDTAKKEATKEERNELLESLEKTIFRHYTTDTSSFYGKSKYEDLTEALSILRMVPNRDQKNLTSIYREIEKCKNAYDIYLILNNAVKVNSSSAPKESLSPTALKAIKTIATIMLNESHKNGSFPSP